MRHAKVVVEGRIAILDFAETAGSWTLSGIVIEVSERESETCGSLEALRTAVFDAAPSARYVPTRHSPGVPEARSEEAMYLLDDRDDVVVLLGPTTTTIYIGRLDALD